MIFPSFPIQSNPNRSQNRSQHKHHRPDVVVPTPPLDRLRRVHLFVPGYTPVFIEGVCQCHDFPVFGTWPGELIGFS